MKHVWSRVVCVRCSSAWSTIALMLCFAGWVGCSGGPSRITPPSIDQDDAAAEAMELYDKDGDGFVDDDELTAAPALTAAMKQLDTNADGKVDFQEISHRIQSWEESNVGLIPVRCVVKLNGRPLVGADVTFEPEPYIANEIPAAAGRTDRYGLAAVSIPMENRPAADAPAGVRFGLYRVRITKRDGDRELVPAKYNTETTLGQEVSYDDAGIQSRIIYDLDGK